MAITQRKDGKVTILEVSGPMTIGTGDVLVRESIHEALVAGERWILLDLKDVNALDSSGVGELMAAYSSVTRHGGTLKLAGLSPKVATVLQVTQMTGLLDVFDTQEEALVAFAQESS
jgi:anti-sigma B factor antagonist